MAPYRSIWINNTSFLDRGAYEELHQDQMIAWLLASSSTQSTCHFLISSDTHSELILFFFVN
jgi:hypothetical protein